MYLLTEIVILLAAAVTVVPIFRRVGLGAVLGYLVAGALVGPWGLGLVGEVEGISHAGEFGVVLLFFVIGLELHPKRLWLMRREIFGLGGAQVVLTALPLTVLAAWLGDMGAREAGLIGVALAFSSTAFALQLLSERDELNTRHGRSAFSVLLFQDIAVVPALALIPVWAGSEAGIAGESPWLIAARTIGLVALIVVLGRYVLRYALRAVALTGVTEVFTAMALLTVALTAMIADYAGLSMALGGFLGGVLLAESEYRHALEADLNPFKGLLLGLFFMAVGMTVNLNVLIEEPGLILALAIGLMLLKAGILTALLRVWGLDHAGATAAAAALSQGGEFAFVLFGAALAAGMLHPELTGLLTVVIILSMALTPPLLTLVSRVVRPGSDARSKREWDTPDEDKPRVILAGFGRFGQIVARILSARGIPFTALEINPDQIDLARRFGNKVHYGDPTRLELLRAAHADEASIFVLAVNSVPDSLSIARTLREHFPHLTIFARARDREHAYQLMELGVTHIYRETFHSSLELTRALLKNMGFKAKEADNIVERFRQTDEERLRAGFGNHHDLERLITQAKESARELERLLKEDRESGER